MTESEQDYFEERAAIYQYDAGMTRAEAEHFALISVEARRAREQMEKEVKESFRDYPKEAK